jgi:hypothetical protein
MSERTSFDLSEQLARFDRAQVESRTFAAEQRRLIAEAANRDRAREPWLVFVVVAGGVGGILAGVTALLQLTGRLP